MTKRYTNTTGPGGPRAAGLLRTTMRMHPEIQHRLEEQAVLENRATWRIVEDALTAYLERHHSAHVVGIGHLD